MRDTETTTTAYVTAPSPASIFLGDDAMIYAAYGRGVSVVGDDYINITLYGVDHVDVGRLLMTPAAATVLLRELTSALTLRDTFGQVSS